MKELVCIVCPRGCRLTVDESSLTVSGNSCPKGEEYGKNEILSPMRTVTSSVAIVGGINPRLAVRTDKTVPKDKIFEIMKVIHSHTVKSPVKRGDVLIENICGTGASLIASRDM